MRPLQERIINELKVKPEINAEEEIRRSVDFLKDYLKKHLFLKALVLGISGGQDSTLAGKLSQMAISELREETGDDAYQFIAVRLPYGDQADEQDAMDAIEFMQADKTVRVNIKQAADAMVQSIEENGLEISDFNKGNIKARERMIAQYGIAGAVSGAVVGTDHAAEAITGFYTKYGDGGADITPLWRLDKRQGRAMLELLNAPEHLYKKVPTADLEEDRPALPDEVALGVTYNDIDDYLEGKEVADNVAEKIENWFLKTEHKRHMPINVYDTFWK
ncbi:ammonia-dependent NAD(+) synthetase [Ligilactobacillus salivarius]|uniref:NH(3)-dependent NAD(+) synthetase n=1 Tax=Ligilactobacillus salivarius TaxID=1624 RepID=A0ABD7YVK5_9LACO|nr:ammonia-dependent NAD(+) synthetase [Ligilactobacillus salivarius]WHS05379.1 ammonia-dependent NAD(+) synthetase [Ligilactobacillus salivarius]WHS08542.1 ammonia-dependent NAD(+) synthetase [Ligilactobacillus salivarius]WHS09293.1 ammonia-dependent NAD(+) synthetase [Ligilactobacillus salivarius]WHS14957.1 ammonia-dependent NAD(+) synthetase [Ligilactobacillus salivarius]WHS18143.1 ammonia-dependent NAD(+) synthetase [Ligilactobacillus salivarius]